MSRIWREETREEKWRKCKPLSIANMLQIFYFALMARQDYFLACSLRMLRICGAGADTRAGHMLSGLLQD